MSNEFPAEWAIPLATPAQRHVLDAAEGRCELRYAACCSGVASVTSGALATDAVHAHRAACQPRTDTGAGVVMVTWLTKLTDNIAARIVIDAHGLCQLGYPRCTSVATTTTIVVPGERRFDHTGACASFAAHGFDLGAALR